MTPLVIAGTGGCAREVHQLIEDINRVAPQWDVLGFVDDNPALQGSLVHGLPVLGAMAALAQDRLHGATLALGIGSPAVRKRLAHAARAHGVTAFATLVHPLAQVGNRVVFGPGTMIWQGAVITTDVLIGEHVIVNTGSTISHDAVLGDYVTFAPAVSVAGAVRVEEGADLGIGVRVIQGHTIGAWSILGAGAVVIGDIDANVTAVGVPARAIKARPAGWHLGRGLP